MHEFPPDDPLHSVPIKPDTADTILKLSVLAIVLTILFFLIRDTGVFHWANQ